MEKPEMDTERRPFRTPEEERVGIAEAVERKRETLEGKGKEAPLDDMISEEIQEFRKRPTEEVVAPENTLSEEEYEHITLDLEPEEHDEQMRQLIELAQEKGVKNALAVVEKLDNPHIEDDFHRFLVAYVKEGLSVTGLKENDPLSRTLHTTLYEVTLPRKGEEGDLKNLKETLSAMEQFFAGMSSVARDVRKGNPFFTIELAMDNSAEEFSFYVSVPDGKEELFENHITAVFPSVHIEKQNDDYNIFTIDGVTSASYATLNANPIFPLRTYDEFDHDPLNAILNSFSKIDAEGEGAAIQFVIDPAGGQQLLSKYKQALEQIQKGVPVEQALDIAYSWKGEIKKTLKEIFVYSTPDPERDEPHIDEMLVDQIRTKIRSPLLMTDLRIITSSRTQEEADAIRSDIESSFNQFSNTHGNTFIFRTVKKRALSKLLRKFSFRSFDKGAALPLNAAELTSCIHFQESALRSSASLKRRSGKTAPAPSSLPDTGIRLGVNTHQGEKREVRIAPEDRLRHLYCVGQTGTGKSTLLKNMAIQDIENGEGVCMIDPHGSDLDDVLAAIPPERQGDVLYFDPAEQEYPMGLNLLEYDSSNPEQKTFVVNELFSIFDKLFDLKATGGPMFEQYFRNAAILVMEDPDSGNTLLEVSRVLSDSEFRKYKLSRSRNPVVNQYWKKVAEKAGGEASLANIVPYITSKFDVFLANDIMRPIITQEHSAFDFRDVMDNRKILLVNLSKGRLGDINAHLIGLILTGKLLMAALSRGSEGHALPPYYVYLDEFQNITTDSISTILSEARKYKVGLTVAHQFIAQLDGPIKDAVFGNVGSYTAFRVGAEDAEFLERQFEPVFSAHDIMNITNRNAYARILVDGYPSQPFSLETLPSPDTSGVDVTDLKRRSIERYGTPRAEVEAELQRKYGEG